MRFKTLIACVIGAFALQTAIAATNPAALHYPKTQKVDQVDDYHGTKVPDPYRWLETDARTSKDVAEWIDAENKVSFGYLNAIPYRDQIKKRLTDLWNYEKVTVPMKRGPHLFFSKNDGLQNQSVWYMVDKWGDAPHVVIDPNSWSKDGTIALSGMAITDDGKYAAYGAAEAGSDWTTWHVLDIESGKLLPDELKWVKFSGASWTVDDKGFFYSRFPQPEAGKAMQSLNKEQKLYYHRLGTPQSQDVIVYYRPDQPDWTYYGAVTDDGRYLLISVSPGGGGEKNTVLVKDLNDPYAAPVQLIDKFENDYTFVGNEGRQFFFRTDIDAAKNRVIAINLDDPARANWKAIIPESDATLVGVDHIGHRLVANYLRDARSEVRVFDMDGKAVRQLPLDGIGTAGGFRGRADDPETFYSFSSFATPSSIYRYNVVTGDSTLIWRAKAGVNPADYVVKQVFYTSKDGTKVPMFITYRKGLKLNGDTPTLLYAYGGFNISQTPSFSVARLVWMQMGGVFALANIRGGGEYGREWHEAGTKLHKQNVFDDFIAAAEYLEKNGYTRPARLAIQGGSNGGLLVGAAITQRADLFGAALPAVGVMDMLRFQKFTAGRYWVEDFGSSDNAEQFKALYAYSPYHNIKPGTKYPATLITTADHDDRVVPGHSFKFAAAIQEAQVGPAPVLIRIETRAGHGGGKPTSKQIEETADAWAFLVKNLGMKLPGGFAK